ncbi:MAG: hypothetical protein IPM81_20145 [Saprospirales bacterium]|nr:hypothetical protein [Saprospirales bacterium]
MTKLAMYCAGNIRIAPELDNIAYSLSGFIAQSDEKNWFSPPFCDTIYELKGYNIIPRYLFDFGSKSVPDEVRGRKIQSGWAVHNFAYLSESFLKIGDNVVFDYFMNQKMHLAFYNEQTETLVLNACSGFARTMIRQDEIPRKSPGCEHFCVGIIRRTNPENGGTAKNRPDGNGTLLHPGIFHPPQHWRTSPYYAVTRKRRSCRGLFHRPDLAFAP